MSPLSTLLATWCAVYAFAAAHYAALWARARRRDAEHLSYATVCVALGAYTAGSAIAVDARSLPDAALGVHLQFAGGFAAVAATLDFANRIIGAPGRRVVIAGIAIEAVSIALALAGRIADPERSSGAGPWDPAFRPEGVAAMACALVLATIAVIAVVRRARADADVRAIGIAGLVTLAAGAHEVAVRLAGLPSRHSVEHAGLATIIMVGYVLMRRYVRAAGELERRTEEVTRSYADLRATQEQLVRKEQLAAVGELSAVIAHEVRNPLAILKNAASSLRRPTLTEADRTTLLGILDEETDRLNRLVRDLLAYARPVPPRGAAVDVEGLVTRAFELAHAGRREGAAVELALDLASGPPAVLGDPELLRHALVNVMGNAVQAMPEGGSISVRAAGATIGTRPAASLSFTDTGVGMDVGVRAKATDPFFTTRPAGTGLGLAIVDRVVKNHGGTLSIESAPGRGTTVTIVLPTPQDATAGEEAEG
jgi:signal transduction histidine kinase